LALIRGPPSDSRFPTPHEAYGLCAVGVPQVKAIGLAVVFDHATSTPLPRHFHATSTPFIWYDLVAPIGAVYRTLKIQMNF